MAQIDEEMGLRNTEHNRKVFQINKFIGGVLPKLITKPNGYTPDICVEKDCYEVEVFRKKKHLETKRNNWSDDHKHILIVCLSDLCFDLFDEVFFFDGEKLILLKDVRNSQNL